VRLSTGAAHATPSFRTLLVGEKREREKNKPSSMQQKNIRLSGFFFAVASVSSEVSYLQIGAAGVRPSFGTLVVVCVEIVRERTRDQWKGQRVENWRENDVKEIERVRV
jgi:hypothetical protein